MSCRTCVNSTSNCGSLDLICCAQVRDDLIDAAVTLALQLHGDVAGVGLGDRGQAHLQARPARDALHFGVF